MRQISRLIAILAVIGGVGAHVRAAKLDTSTLLGVWDGTFTNDTFGTNGTIHVVTTVESADSVRVDWTLVGNVFGCGSVGPVGGVLLRDLKSNGFNDTRIFVKGEDSVFGEVKIKNRGMTFKARGKHPCEGLAAKKYRAKATLDADTLAGTMKIKLAGSGTAQASFTVTKAP